MHLKTYIHRVLIFAVLAFASLNLHANTAEVCDPLRQSASIHSLTIIKKELGQGSEGLIHMAKDSFGQRFALKAHAEEYVKQHEYEVTNKIHKDHPGNPALKYVVRYDLAEVEGREYLIAPFYKMDLDRLLLEIREGIFPISAFNAKDFVDKLERGINLIHQSGYVHADLKPQNVAVDADLNPVIIDFGMSVKKGKKYQGGTESYMSPNQRNDGRAEPNDDLIGGLKGIKTDILNALGVASINSKFNN